MQTIHQTPVCQVGVARESHLGTPNNLYTVRIVSARIARLTVMLIHSLLVRLRELRTSEAQSSVSSGSPATGSTARSSRTNAQIFSVPECIVIHFVSIVICFSGCLGKQVMYHCGLTKSWIGVNQISLKHIEELPFSASPVNIFCFEPLAGNFRHYAKLSPTPKVSRCRMKLWKGGGSNLWRGRGSTDEVAPRKFSQFKAYGNIKNQKMAYGEKTEYGSPRMVI